ncbi:uncharacterized protein [Venturia canescens]|uniref:uncharacterized protein n=1 Tax=Venturia canescens TaxID=32260 RepID=UPI001C9C808F|nr:uncharacterized protein LOC122415689 [Venturia canescens]
MLSLFDNGMKRGLRLTPARRTANEEDNKWRCEEKVIKMRTMMIEITTTIRVESYDRNERSAVRKRGLFGRNFVWIETYDGLSIRKNRTIGKVYEYMERKLTETRTTRKNITTTTMMTTAEFQSYKSFIISITAYSVGERLGFGYTTSKTTDGMKKKLTKRCRI